MNNRDSSEIKKLLNLPLDLEGLSIQEIIEKILSYSGVGPPAYTLKQMNTRPKHKIQGIQVDTTSTVFQIFPDDREFDGFYISVKPSVSVSIRGNYVKNITSKYRTFFIKNRQISIDTLSDLYDVYETHNLILAQDIVSPLISVAYKNKDSK